MDEISTPVMEDSATPAVAEQTQAQKDADSLANLERIERENNAGGEEITDEEDFPEEEEEAPTGEEKEEEAEDGADEQPEVADLEEPQFAPEEVARQREAGRWLFGRHPDVQAGYLAEVEPVVSYLAQRSGALTAEAIHQHLTAPLNDALQRGVLTVPLLQSALHSFEEAMSAEMAALVAYTGVHTGIHSLEAARKNAGAGKVDKQALEQTWFGEVARLNQELGREGRPLSKEEIAEATQDLNEYLSLGLAPEKAVAKALRTYRKGLRVGREVERKARVMAATRRGHGSAHRTFVRAPKAGPRTLYDMVADPKVGLEELERFAAGLE